MKPTGPYHALVTQARKKREATLAAAELRMIAKEAQALSLRALAVVAAPHLAQCLGEVAEFARNLAKLTEEQ